MERTKVAGVTTSADSLPKLRYKVLSGKLKIFGRVYVKDNIFEAYPNQIPAAFKINLKCVSDPVTEEKVVAAVDAPPPMEKEALYKVVAAKAGGWYNVVNEVSGKFLNEKSLRKGEAEALCESLNNA